MTATVQDFRQVLEDRLARIRNEVVDWGLTPDSVRQVLFACNAMDIKLAELMTTHQTQKIDVRDGLTALCEAADELKKACLLAAEYPQNIDPDWLQHWAKTNFNLGTFSNEPTLGRAHA